MSGGGVGGGMASRGLVETVVVGGRFLCPDAVLLFVHL